MGYHLEKEEDEEEVIYNQYIPEMEHKIWSSLENKLLILMAVIVILLIINLNSHHTCVAAAAASFNRNQTDRFSLMQIKSQISGDPQNILINSWNQSVHHCHWQGVTCDARHGRVTKLDLKGKNLLGSISPHIGNLSFLQSIELQENRLTGGLPPEIGRLSRLKHLNVSINTLTGQIPVNLTHCSELVNLSATNNGLTGSVPSELGSLRKLMVLSFARNILTGYIPTSLGNLSSLNFFSLGTNHLEGYVPKELGRLTSLSFFSVGENSLVGTFPYFLSNISTLSRFSVATNFLHGNLPQDFGFKLPNLEEFDVGANYFSGVLPNSIANATKLKTLCLHYNKLEGQVPINLGNLPSLRYFYIGRNLLGLNTARDLSFISSLTNCTKLEALYFGHNNFGGVLPKTIGNLSSQLKILRMDSNKISGEIPLEIVNLVNLYILVMGENSFIGALPGNFGGFQFLQGLFLSKNKLSGPIPSTLFNITNTLYDVELSSNDFEGTIPAAAIGNCTNLKTLSLSRNKLTGEITPIIFGKSFSPTVLDFSHNSFTGSLPSEVGKFKNLNVANFSYNNFSGEIPISIGDCSSLEYLLIQGNSLSGQIPPTMASLKGLRHLDLSQNRLTGEIPRVLGGLTFLEYLNLSFNDLEGEIPFTGVFRNGRTEISLEGNRNLGWRQHSSHAHKKRIRKILVIILVPMLFIAILIYTVFLLHTRKIRGKKQQALIMSTREEEFIKVSFHELHRATGGFSPDNLIGSGSFGLVYKGIISNQRHGNRQQVVAVKVLDCQKHHGATTSFKAECKALRNIRHRNLVRVITYCSSIDGKGQEFKALVYEFMENGSLETWLHHPADERSRNHLNLDQRLNIAIDVASALDYLQNHTNDEVPIVHCDLKPSNVLLDKDLTAHVSDFGLARLLLSRTSENSSAQGITSNSTTTSTVGIKGTIGYVPPEYGTGNEASIEGDVYSYGILLLELFTGRRPIDNIFTERLDLHSFVKMNFPEQIMDIVDPSLGFTKDQNHGVDFKRCLLSIFNVGLKCSARLPKDRMTMNEVIKEFVRIKEAFFIS